MNFDLGLLTFSGWIHAIYQILVDFLDTWYGPSVLIMGLLLLTIAIFGYSDDECRDDFGSILREEER